MQVNTENVLSRIVGCVCFLRLCHSRAVCSWNMAESARLGECHLRTLDSRVCLSVCLSVSVSVSVSVSLSHARTHARTHALHARTPPHTHTHTHKLCVRSNGATCRKGSGCWFLQSCRKANSWTESIEETDAKTKGKQNKQTNKTKNIQYQNEHTRELISARNT